MASITGVQIRMARAALRWSLHDLAEKAGISRATAQRMEIDDDKLNASPNSIQAVQAALEAAGCAFKDGHWNIGPAIRAPSPAFQKRQQQDTKQK